MDRDLNRSVRLLEDALSAHGKSLLRSTPTRSPRTPVLTLQSRLETPPHEDVIGDFRKVLFQPKDVVINETLSNILDTQSVTGTIIQVNKPWQHVTDSLYTEFLEIIQARTSAPEVFETVADLARCCTDAISVIRSLKSKVTTSLYDEEQWLINERNTWRLIYCLYQDRLSAQENAGAELYFGHSEKLCVENLYRRESLVRESQLIIDWLECSAAEYIDELTKLEHFTDKTVAWENTLHQLKSPENIVIPSSRTIVTSLDPDAPSRERLPLHDLDAEDESRLNKRIFLEIRSGNLKRAQELCAHCGHKWKAAMLIGWTLYHDPNKDGDVNALLDKGEDQEAKSESVDSNLETVTMRKVKKNTQNEIVRREIEGNRARHIWKRMSWDYCQENLINIYERASIAALCGCLPTLLQVCNSWEDYLWSYIRCLVDIRVESEIRDYVDKSYLPMPDEYWSNQLSLDEVFRELESSTNTRVKEESKLPDYLIQKYLILDQIPSLMKSIAEWISIENTSPQFLRFLTHLVLFLKQIGQLQHEEIADNVLESYVKFLIQKGEPQLVAFYTATLGQQQQVRFYALFCESITEDEKRKEALSCAEDAGLDTRAITKQVVENIRSKLQNVDLFQSLQHKVSPQDEEKISALDWILYYPDQRTEALYQCNRVIHSFLTFQKVDSARLAFNKIPVDCITTILATPEQDLPEDIQTHIREHLSYKAYLDAYEAFDSWFKYYNHSRPTPPPELQTGATFTEKVAHEHKVSQYNAETERWKLTISHLAKTAKTMLYNVLLFPDGGWLYDIKDVENLRNSCIPEVVLLLYSVLFESKDFTECIQLADILASEKHQLYKVFSKQQLREVLTKLCECSVALLNEKKDPWGVPMTI